MITRSSPSEFSGMGDAELIAHGRGVVMWNDMQTDERSKDNQKTNMIAALITALAAHQWQPMETAPENTIIEVCQEIRHGDVHHSWFASFDDDGNAYREPGRIRSNAAPTHWRRLFSTTKARRMPSIHGAEGKA